MEVQKETNFAAQSGMHPVESLTGYLNEKLSDLQIREKEGKILDGRVAVVIKLGITTVTTSVMTVASLAEAVVRHTLLFMAKTLTFFVPAKYATTLQEKVLKPLHRHAYFSTVLFLDNATKLFTNFLGRKYQAKLENGLINGFSSIYFNKFSSGILNLQINGLYMAKESPIAAHQEVVEIKQPMKEVAAPKAAGKSIDLEAGLERGVEVDFDALKKLHEERKAQHESEPKKPTFAPVITEEVVETTPPTVTQRLATHSMNALSGAGRLAGRASLSLLSTTGRFAGRTAKSALVKTWKFAGRIAYMPFAYAGNKFSNLVTDKAAGLVTKVTGEIDIFEGVMDGINFGFGDVGGTTIERPEPSYARRMMDNSAQFIRGVGIAAIRQVGGLFSSLFSREEAPAQLALPAPAADAEEVRRARQRATAALDLA